tara:strand:- start:11328 stop:12296 length:969 start_codon:yes stop_codon:yes gene_type:complete
VGRIKRRIKENLLTLVIPFYNEESCIEETLNAVINYLNKMEIPFELILINDGSTDQSLNLVKRTTKKFKLLRGRLISFTRNFGKEAAITAGLKFSKGDLVIPFDSDLQDPPEIIWEMIKKWEEGYDIVNAVRKFREGETFLKKITAFYFYRLLKLISNIDIEKDTGDFRLLDKKVVDSILLLPERTRFMKGLYSWVGYKKTSIYFKRHSRLKSKSNLSYFYLINHALDGIFSFSKVPLTVISILGLIISTVSIIYAMYLIIKTIILGIDVPGYASLMTASLLLGGIQLISLGVLGEYLARVFLEVKKRPLYLIEAKREINQD